jgi:hypothetical protein
VDRDEALEMVDVTPRGSATTAPPPPRRHDFQPQPGDQGDQPEPERWELFDEVGDLVGELEAGDWGNKLVNMASKLGDKERAQLLENNVSMAKTICEAIEDEQIAAGIQGIFAPAETEGQDGRPAAKDWSLPANIVGQEKKLLAIYAMLDGKSDGTNVESAAEVDMLWEAHEAFFATLGQIKKSAANQRFGDRKRALAQAEQS